jgi:head-tail adaptor
MLTNLPHRISFMKPSRTVFEGGCYTTTLKSLSVEWANVQKINMQNNVQNFKDQQVNFYKVTIRNSTIGTNTITVDNSLSVYWDNRILKVNAVADGSNRGKMLRLDCEEEFLNG